VLYDGDLLLPASDGVLTVGAQKSWVLNTLHVWKQ
jgi:hypothetical protein